MSGLEVSVRCIHLASVLLLVGTFGFELLISRPAFKTAGAQTSLPFQSFYKAQFRIAYLSLVLAIGTTILGLFIKIASATGLSLSQSFDAGAVMNLLTGTRFGVVWLFRMILSCLLVAMVSAEFFGWLKHDSVRPRVGKLILSAILLMGMAAAGHASAAEGITLFIQLAVDGLHLLAAGVWLGGLIPLAMLLSWARSTPQPSTLLIAKEATARFSCVGFVSVVTLLITGLFNAWYLVGEIPRLLGTDYGYLLLVKLAILIPLMGLASRNRWRLKPRLDALTSRYSFEKIPPLLAQIRRGVIGEVSLGAAILLIVGIMGITPPARHVQPDWPLSF